MNITNASVSIAKGVSFLTTDQIDSINAIPQEIFEHATKQFLNSENKESFYQFLTDLNPIDPELFLLKKRALFVLSTIVENKANPNYQEPTYLLPCERDASFSVLYSATSQLAVQLNHNALLSAYLIFFDTKVFGGFNVIKDKEIELLEQRKTSTTTAEQDAIQRFIEFGGSISDQYNDFHFDIPHAYIKFYPLAKIPNTEPDSPFLQFNDIAFSTQFQKMCIFYYEHLLENSCQSQLREIFGVVFTAQNFTDIFSFYVGRDRLRLPITLSELGFVSSGYFSAYYMFYVFALSKVKKGSEIKIPMDSRSPVLHHFMEYITEEVETVIHNEDNNVIDPKLEQLKKTYAESMNKVTSVESVEIVLENKRN